MKPFKLLKFVEERKLKQLAKKYYPKSLDLNAMSRQQLLVSLNSKIIYKEKKPLLIYLQQLNNLQVKNNPELKKLLNQLISSNESVEVINKAAELLNKKHFKKSKGSTKSFVYLIQENVSNTIKIGYTNNPERRITEFKVLLPFKIKHIHTIGCESGREVEKLLHKYYHHKRVNGEWFRLSTHDIEDIKNLNLPKNILKAIDGENRGSYQTKQKKKLDGKKATSISKQEKVDINNFDDDYLIYEPEYDEFHRNPTFETYDDNKYYPNYNRNI